MEEGINVLSLFDGMSCGQIALERAGIKVNKYFASEIDKYAIKVTMANYPETIQLGDVRNIKAEDLPKIDLLIGGSPCQGFSFAGRQLNFDDPRSKLFFEYVRLLDELKPKWFMLENVKMKKESQDIITKHLSREPIEINSSLVSAQNRRRLYWTSCEHIRQPENRNILLGDILIGDNKGVDREKAFCIDASYYKGSTLKQYLSKSRRQIVFTNEPYDENYKSNRALNVEEFKKFNTLRANAGSRTRGIGICNRYGYWRKLTPVECERLQTVPDNYTNHVSNTQRYKMLGNGWTVDVVAHIFRGMLDS